MELKDLAHDEIYYWESNNTQRGCINKFNKYDINKNISYFISLVDKYLHRASHNINPKNIRLATPEEKHWLNECIRLNKYISKEEAMVTYMPEKWWLELNIDTISYINEYRSKQPNFNHPLTLGVYEGICYEGYGTRLQKRYANDEALTKITLEQFLKYVLRQNIKEVIVKVDSKLFTLDEIRNKLSKYYDKDDIKEILEIISK